MMGKIIEEDKPVTKTTKGLIVLSVDHPLITDLTKDISQMLKESRTSCMHCSLCTEVCPRNLIGHRIEPNKLIRMESYASVNTDSEFPKTAFLCCECRLCQYACVMNLKPWKVNSLLKVNMSKNGIKNNLNNIPNKVHPFREYKKYPVKRLISKLGLYKYDIEAPLTEVKQQFNKVSISLKQHIGVPAEAVVKAGDKVVKGNLIADIPDGKMGCRVHASISGTVIETNKDTIIIEGV
jgi:Na+-translocating ferredoxin:NAD+ oxidoreductase RnfC subunit